MRKDKKQILPQKQKKEYEEIVKKKMMRVALLNYFSKGKYGKVLKNIRDQYDLNIEVYQRDFMTCTSL